MRVDPYYVSNLVGSLDQTQVTEQQLTNELSSGVRVTSLSQDPVAAGQNVLLLNQIQQDDSFTQSSSLVRAGCRWPIPRWAAWFRNSRRRSRWPQREQRTMNSSQVKSIANQLAGILDEVTSLANTSYQGQYIFGGGQTSAPPFSTSNLTTPATTTYSGDQNVNCCRRPMARRFS